MQKSPGEVLFAFFLIFSFLGILFGTVIYFGLKFRKKNMFDNLNLKADDLWIPFEGTSFNKQNLVYGLWQDFSSTQMGLIVRNFRDEQIATVSYNPLQIVLKIGEETFEADVLLTWKPKTELHKAGAGEPVLCTFSRPSVRTFLFEAKNIGSIECKRRKLFEINVTYNITLEGIQIGCIRQTEGNWLAILPDNISLPIRVFLLAIHGKR